MVLGLTSNPCQVERYCLNRKVNKLNRIMKTPNINLSILLFIPLFFISCNKASDNFGESEIVFQVPVYKGIGEPGISNVVVFPNPFTSSILVASNFPDGNSAEVQLSDEKGNFSIKTEITVGVVAFDTKDFPKGIYYIEIKKDGYVDRAKMFKIESN